MIAHAGIPDSATRFEAVWDAWPHRAASIGCACEGERRTSWTDLSRWVFPKRKTDDDLRLLYPLPVTGEDGWSYDFSDRRLPVIAAQSVLLPLRGIRGLLMKPGF